MAIERDTSEDLKMISLNGHWSSDFLGDNPKSYKLIKKTYVTLKFQEIYPKQFKPLQTKTNELFIDQLVNIVLFSAENSPLVGEK